MYNHYFGLTDSPFSIAPDPRFLYMSHQHREALAHLLYGVQNDGCFVLLTGEVGTGKTTICRCFLQQVPEDTQVAYIVNPKLSALELLANLCDELGIIYDTSALSNKQLIDCINQHLLESYAQGKNTVLIIDEAQNLSAEVLEQIRLLTNLETDQKKLLQLVLMGQPELQSLLQRDDLRQLSQRITARYHLGALGFDEMRAYIEHRLRVAGCSREIFPATSLKRLQRLSCGIPRVINIICDRALLGAYVGGEQQVSVRVLTQAAREVLGERNIRLAPQWPNPISWLAGTGAAALLLSLVIWLWPGQGPEPQLAEQASQPLSTALAQGNSPERGDSLERDNSPERDNSLERKNSPEQNKQALGNSASPSEYNEPAGVNSLVSRTLAVQGLFQLWGIDLVGYRELSPCAVAALRQLACYQYHGDLALLRQLDRPAVLSLTNGAGHSYYALLQHLDDEAAWLGTSDGLKRYQLSELQAAWDGNFSLLWRRPPGYVRSLRLGDDSTASTWLVEQLQALGWLGEINLLSSAEPLDDDQWQVIGPPGTEAAAQPQVNLLQVAGSVFNAEVEAAVKRFQAANNLGVDGVVGVQSLIVLNHALVAEQRLQIAAPRLQPPLE